MMGPYKNKKQKDRKNIEGRGVYINTEQQFLKGIKGAKEGKEKVKEIISTLSENKLNFVLPLMNSRGKVYYNGKLGQSYTREWDPLEEIVKEAHKNDMEVHPWFCAFEEGGEKAKQNPNIVLVKKDGSLINALDPGNPEARNYMINLIMEAVKNYDIDGINLDYVRYPREDIICYCAHCRSNFKKKYGVDLADLSDNNPMLARWDRYREEQTTTFVKDLRQRVRAEKPYLEISLYHWMPYSDARIWPQWIKNGYLDWVNPTGYKYTFREFRLQCRRVLDIINGVCPAYITIGVKTSHGELTSVNEIIEQVKIAREEGADGIVFFTSQALMPFLKDLSKEVFV